MGPPAATDARDARRAGHAERMREEFLRGARTFGRRNHRKSPYAVANMDKVRKTMMVSTLADSSALKFVKRAMVKATAFQKNACACGDSFHSCPRIE